MALSNRANHAQVGLSGAMEPRITSGIFRAQSRLTSKQGFPFGPFSGGTRARATRGALKA